MRIKKQLFVLLMVFGCFASSYAAKTIALTPKPTSMTVGTGEFSLIKGMSLSYPAFEGDSVRTICDRFLTGFNTATGLHLTAGQDKADAKISLTIDTKLPTEAYTLKVTTSGIAITASKPIGFFFALQSLKQLMPRNVMAEVADASVEAWSVPVVSISDQPRFGWRGFMLDVGRHFFDKNEIKTVLDILATYKMNRFHWHLTEDQGWRIEIKKYPKLTSVGAWRNSKVLAWGSTKEDGIHYGGFYTQEDVKEIVKYAQDRFIDIVPEVDMPGHSQAAVACYPEFLACDPNKSHSVWTSQGISSDVINVCNPKAVQFAKDVIDELIELFPFGYIHVGGDECPTTKWESNQACKDTLASLGSTKYRDLQLHFYHQLESYIQSKPADKQRKLVYWNEVLDGNVALLTNPTIMAWTGADGAAKNAAQKGFDNILSPQIPYYINRKQSSDPGEPATQGSGSETVKAVYSYSPASGITDQNLLKHYKGVQGNFWTEWVIEPSWVEYLMLPRIAAIAEAGWTPQASRNYDDFVNRIREDSTLYNLKGWQYGKHVMTVTPKGGAAFIKSVGTPVTDIKTIKTGDVVLIKNVTASVPARQGYFNVSNDIIKTNKSATFTNFTTDYSTYLWEVTVTADGKYSFRNLSTNLSIPVISASGANYATTKAAGIFNIAKTTTSGAFSVQSDANKSIYWNGNEGSFASWNDAQHSFSFTLVDAANVPYYRIKNVENDEYMTSNGSQASMTASNGSSSLLWEIKKNTSYTAATQNRTSNPYVLFASVYDAIMNGAADAMSNKGVATSAYAIAPLGQNQYSLKNGGNKFTAASGSSVADVDAATINGNAAWMLEPASELIMNPQNINSKFMSAVGLPYAVNVPEGMKAYYVDATVNAYAGLKEFSGKVIPANSSVLLVGDNLNPYYVTPAATSTPTTITNLLKSTGLSEIDAPANGYYLLGGKGLILGTSSKIPAFTTYVEKTADMTSDTFTFTFGELTGVESINVATPVRAAYDLNGRRVENPENGIFIINGKKIKQ